MSAIGGRIIARKRKLLDKQKAGTKNMRQFGRVEILRECEDGGVMNGCGEHYGLH